MVMAERKSGREFSWPKNNLTEEYHIDKQAKH
jgi:hypothetical protein